MQLNPTKPPVWIEAIKWAAAAFLLLAFLAAYHAIILETLSSWVQLERSYGLLIFIISLYMLWNKKADLMATPVTPAPLTGGMVVFAGCGLLLISQLSFTLMLQGVALVITALGIVWAAMGTRQLALWAVPIGYLLFMFSIIEEFLGFFSKTLQLLAAQLAAAMLRIKGMPVFIQHEFIELPHITLEVAKVCNGVNHIIALVALAIPMAVISPMSVWKKWAFVFFALVVGLFANGLRVAMIGWWTVKYSEASIHGPFEFFYVSFILVFGLAIIGSARLVAGKSHAPASASTPQHPASLRQWRLWPQLQAAPFLIAGVLLTTTAAFGYQFAAAKTAPLQPLTAFPYEVGSHIGQDVADDQWPLKHIDGDLVLRRLYKDPSRQSKIGLLVAFFENQTQTKKVVNQKLMWLHLKSTPFTVPLDNATLMVNRGLPRGLEDQTFAGDKRPFYFYYYVNGTTITDPYRAKLHTLLHGLIHRRSDGAIVVFSDESGRPESTQNAETMRQFIRHAYPILQEHLKTK